MGHLAILTNTKMMSHYIAVSGPLPGGATDACAPPLFKEKNPFSIVELFVFKYNMNKQNFDLTFLGKFIY